MYKGRLLASVCALGLIVAAPAFAQAPATKAPATQPPAHQGPSTTSHMTRAMHPRGPVHKMMGHHRMARRRSVRRVHRRASADNSQNAAVDQLNEQSLQAARRGTSFMGSGAAAPAHGGAASPPPGKTRM